MGVFILTAGIPQSETPDKGEGGPGPPCSRLMQTHQALRAPDPIGSSRKFRPGPMRLRPRYQVFRHLHISRREGRGTRRRETTVRSSTSSTSARRLSVLVGVALLVGFALAPVVLAQGLPTATLSGRARNDALDLPGVTVTAKSPALQGTRTTVTGANGTYVLANLPPGEYQITFTIQGFKAQTLTKTLGRVAAGDPRREPRDDGHRDDDGHRPERLDLAVARPGDDVHGRRPQQAPDGAHDHVGGQPLARRQPERPERGLDLGRAVHREPLHGQRRHDHGQRALLAEQPLHRGRHSGDDDDHVEHLGRVRAVHRRRDQHDHEVRRQHVLRLVPLDAQQQRLELHVRLPDRDGREPAGRHLHEHGPDLRGDARRPDPQGHALVLRGRPLPRHERRPHLPHALHEHPVHERREGDAVRGQADLLARPEPHPHRLVHRREPRRRQLLLHEHPRRGPREHLRPQLPQELMAFNYNGVLSSNFFLEGSYSKRKFTFENSGGRYQDIVKGTASTTSRSASVQRADLLRRLRPREARQQRVLRQGHVLPLDAGPRLAQHRRSATTTSPASACRTTTSPAATTSSTRSDRARSSRGRTSTPSSSPVHRARLLAGPQASRAATSGRSPRSSTTRGA